MLMRCKTHDTPKSVLDSALCYAHSMVHPIPTTLCVSPRLSPNGIRHFLRKNVDWIDFRGFQQAIGNGPSGSLTYARRFVILSGIILMPRFLHPLRHTGHCNLLFTKKWERSGPNHQQEILAKQSGEFLPDTLSNSRSD